MKAGRLWRAADLILIFSVAAAAVLAALLLWRPASGEPVAVIAVAGNELDRIRLSAVASGYDLPLDTEPGVVLRVEPGRIRFAKADCPDQVCVNSGWLSSPGQTAVCLPARVSVLLEGDGGVDAVVR